MGRGQALLTGGRGVGTLSVCQGLSNFIAFIDLNRDQAPPISGALSISSASMNPERVKPAALV
jgi:hypothetical protein